MKRNCIDGLVEVGDIHLVSADAVVMEVLDVHVVIHDALEPSLSDSEAEVNLFIASGGIFDVEAAQLAEGGHAYQKAKA